MALRDSGYRLDFNERAGKYWLDRFRCDRREALSALERWKEYAVELLYGAMEYNAGEIAGPPWHVSPLVRTDGQRPMFSLPGEFIDLTDIVALWCDSELRIDPTAMTEIRRRFNAFAPRNAAGPVWPEVIQVRTSMTDQEMEDMMHKAMDLFDRVYRTTQQRPALSNEEARNRFCYEEWQRGQTYKEIFAAVKKHPEWESFTEALGVRSAINAWARKNSLPIREGSRGRRPKAR